MELFMRSIGRKYSDGHSAFVRDLDIYLVGVAWGVPVFFMGGMPLKVVPKKTCVGDEEKKLLLV